MSDLASSSNTTQPHPAFREPLAVLDHEVSFFAEKPEDLNETSGQFLEKYPLNFREQLAFDVKESMKKWALEQLRTDVETLAIE